MKKKPLIIAGISIAVVGLGYLVYKLIEKSKYDVVNTDHNTIMVMKEVPKDVESDGYPEDSVSEEQKWTNDTDSSLQQQLAEFESQSIYGNY